MKKHTLLIAIAACFATAGVANAAPPIIAPAQVHPASSSAQLSTAQRSAIVARIVRTWGAYVQLVHGTSAGAWAQRMQATFGAATDSNLQRAAGMKTFQGMMDALVGQHLTDAQVNDALATQAQVLESGAKPALLGSTTADLTFTPLANCRIVDTHVVGGPITGGFTRSFKAHTTTDFTAQGGATSRCGIPANPSVLMLNVTTLAPTQAGSLSVYPYGTTRPKDANLNYKVGQNVNNEMAAKMTIGSATDDFTVYVSGTTDVLIDVVGYFMAPQATALDCTREHNAVDVPAGPGSYELITACPAGRTVTGGGCGTNITTELAVIWSTQSYSSNAWYCSAVNTGTTTHTLEGDAICCAIPGR
jgi:hypothetical protein